MNSSYGSLYTIKKGPKFIFNKWYQKYFPYKCDDNKLQQGLIIVQMK